MNLIYKEIEKKDEKQLRGLIKTVLESLENPQFFIPYADWELEQLYDKSYAPLHGAYDGDKLVGMAQLYIRQDFLYNRKVMEKNFLWSTVVLHYERQINS